MFFLYKVVINKHEFSVTKRYNLKVRMDKNIEKKEVRKEMINNCF